MSYIKEIEVLSPNEQELLSYIFENYTPSSQRELFIPVKRLNKLTKVEEDDYFDETLEILQNLLNVPVPINETVYPIFEAWNLIPEGVQVTIKKEVSDNLEYAKAYIQNFYCNNDKRSFLFQL